MRLSGIAPSIRLVLGMIRLYADINSGFGKALLGLIGKSYPGEKIDLDPQAIGAKMMNIVKKQVQQDETRAQDVIQDWLTYMVKHDQDFKADFPKWQDALDATYTNLRRRAISESMGKTKKKKVERSVDQAYGQRPEGGGSPEGGEGRMPTDPESLLGKALDDKAAIKEFVDLIDKHYDDLKSSLSADSKALFELIFEDDIGSFGSDIKENMGQASELKKKHPELFKQHEKRWSGFVGDLRKKLLDEILDYIDKNMDPDEFDVLKETFFGDVDPSAVRRMEKKKVQDKLDYQRGIDERKVARLKWKDEQGSITPAEKKSLDSLTKKLEKEGVDVKAIKAEEKPAKGEEAEPESQVATIHRDFDIAQIMVAQMKVGRSLKIAARVASKKTKADWS